MRISILIFFSVIFIGHVDAQFKLTLRYDRVWHGKEGQRYYELILDSTVSAEDSCVEYYSQAINVKSLADSHLIQNIATPENHFDCGMVDFNYYKGELFCVEDVNFDGFADILLRQCYDKDRKDSVFYFYWIYNRFSGRYERDTTLEGLIKPDFYECQDEKCIVSMNLLNPDDTSWKKYQFINGQLLLIEEEEAKVVVYNGKDALERSKWKLVKGKWKLVERKIEFPQVQY